MKWQHCGRMGDHQEHTFVARQAVTVQSCTCGEDRCVCVETPTPLWRKRERFTCPGKQVRSVEIPVTTEVSV